MAAKKSSQHRATSKRDPARASASRSTSSGSTDTDAVLERLDGVVGEFTRLRETLGTESSDAVSLPEGTLRRIDLMTAMLADERERIESEDPGTLAAGWTRAFRGTGAASSPAPLPLITTDDSSVGLDVPGVGSVRVGADGAAASVDGLGGASVGKEGISVHAGGAAISVGGDGASITIPGVGSVRVGADGAISVDPGKGSPGAGIPGLPSPSLPFPPLPCPQACEFKIPIPVPKFVAEPFEIPIHIPKFDFQSTQIAIPIPQVSFAPTPIGPIPIPYPTTNGFPAFPKLPSLPGWDDFFSPVPIPYPAPGSFDPASIGGYDSQAEELIIRLLRETFRELKHDTRDVAIRLKAWSDSVASVHDRLAAEARKIAEQFDAQLDECADALQSLHELLVITMGNVTDAVRAVASRFRHALSRVLANIKEWMKLIVDVADAAGTAGTAVLELPLVGPALGAMLSTMRQLLLASSWAMSRVFSLIGYSADLFERFSELGPRAAQVYQLVDG